MTPRCRLCRRHVDPRTLAAGGEVCYDCATAPPSRVWILRSLAYLDDETGDPLYWSQVDGWVARDTATPSPTPDPDATGMIGGAVWEVR